MTGIIQLLGRGTPASTGKLTITRQFDTNTGSRASPGSAFAGDATLANNFFNGIDEACNFFERHFCRTAKTIVLQFGWGTLDNSPFAGGLTGNSSVPAGTPVYSTLRSNLISRAVTANAIAALGSFPVSDPTSGNLNVFSAYWVAVLGSNRFITPDAWIGINSGNTYFWTQSGGAGTGFDFVGSVQHEISETMDRTRVVPVTQPNPTTLEDMLTYSGTGVRDWNVGGYLSVDQGATNDGNWNTTPGNDFGDFDNLTAPGGIDACNALLSPNVLCVFSQRDIDSLDCIGWQYVP